MEKKIVRILFILIYIYIYIYIISFNDKQIELLQNLYNDASLGLTTEKNYMII